MAARLVIQLLDGDTVVHEFSRSTSQPVQGDEAAGVVKMIGAAMGWLQAYQGAVNSEQWRADVRRAEAAQS